MNEPNSNPPAFPCTGNPNWDHDQGMTLRDYFAAAALQGMLAGMGFDAPLKYEASPAPPYVNVAYEFADAMLAERAKQK